MTPTPLASPVFVQLVASSPPSMWAAWVPALVAIITAAAALYGVNANNRNAWKVAERQYRATIVAASRQKWIDAVRDTTVEMVDTFRGLNFTSSWYRTECRKIRAYARRLSLSFNPEDPDSNIIARGIERALDEFHRGEGSAAASEAALSILDTDVVPAIQRQLGEAWQRIKRGE